MRKYYIAHTIYSTLCSDLIGKEVPKRRDIRRDIVDSLFCTAETGKTLYSNYILIKNQFSKPCIYKAKKKKKESSMSPWSTFNLGVPALHVVENPHITLFLFYFIFNWRIVTVQYCADFCYTST